MFANKKWIPWVLFLAAAVSTVGVIWNPHISALVVIAVGSLIGMVITMSVFDDSSSPPDEFDGVHKNLVGYPGYHASQTIENMNNIETLEVLVLDLQSQINQLRSALEASESD